MGRNGVRLDRAGEVAYFRCAVRVKRSLSSTRNMEQGPSRSAYAGGQLGSRARKRPAIHHKPKVDDTYAAKGRFYLRLLSSHVATCAAVCLIRRRYTRTRFSWRDPKTMGGAGVVAVWRLPRGFRRRFPGGELARHSWHTGVTFPTTAWSV